MTSLLKPEEVRRAQIGPRQLKDRRSREYAIQTVYSLKRGLESSRIDAERVQRDLADIDRYRHWEVLGYSSKDALLRAEIGMDARGVQAAIDAAPENLPTRQEQPGGRGKKTSSDTTSLGRGTSYLAARLKRDHPDICVRIKAGEFRSIRAAAIAAGIVKVKTPLDVLRVAWRKASPAERETFLRETTETTETTERCVP